jgi:hypothetical protein
MLPDAVRFDAVDLARQIESLSQYVSSSNNGIWIFVERDGAGERC